MSMQATPEVNPANEAPAEGRAANGRFTIGNKGGPGNPFAREVAGLRQALLKRINAESIDRIAAKLISLAEEGNLQAIKMVFDYAIGKPQPAPDPDRMDVDEWDVYKQTAPMKTEAAAMSKAGSPHFHINTVRTMRPIIDSLVQLEINGLVQEAMKPKEEREAAEAAKAAECEAILNSPAPPLPGDPDFPSSQEEYDRLYSPSANGVFGAPPPSPNGQNGRGSPSTNGKKRRSKRGRRKAQPLTNGRFQME